MDKRKEKLKRAIRKKKVGEENYYSWGDKELYGLHIDGY